MTGLTKMTNKYNLVTTSHMRELMMSKSDEVSCFTSCAEFTVSNGVEANQFIPTSLKELMCK